jgi:hypothetical protein
MAGAIRHRRFVLSDGLVVFLLPEVQLGLQGLALVVAGAGAALLMWPALAQQRGLGHGIAESSSILGHSGSP